PTPGRAGPGPFRPGFPVARFPRLSVGQRQCADRAVAVGVPRRARRRRPSRGARRHRDGAPSWIVAGERGAVTGPATRGGDRAAGHPHLGAVPTYRQVFAIAEFRALVAVNAIAVADGTLRMLALSVLVYRETGSPLLAAIAYLGGFLPQAIGSTVLMSLA